MPPAPEAVPDLVEGRALERAAYGDADLAPAAVETLAAATPTPAAPDLVLAGPAPAASASMDDIVAAVRAEFAAAANVWRSDLDGQQAAVLAAARAAAQASADQAGDRLVEAMRAWQDEQLERQQASLRRLQDEQAASLQFVFKRLLSEQAEAETDGERRQAEAQLTAFRAALAQLAAEQRDAQRALAQQVQSAVAAALPASLNQLRDDLASRQDHALAQLRADLGGNTGAPALAAPASRLPAVVSQSPERQLVPAEGGAPMPPVTVIRELSWQLENNAISAQQLANRVGAVLWVNLFMLLLVGALAAAIGYVFRAELGLVPAPTATAVPSATPLPPTPLPPTATALPPTVVPAPTATQPPSPTVVPFGAVVDCAEADRPRQSYDCTVTNSGLAPDRLSLTVLPEGGAANGFNPFVAQADGARIARDPATGYFPLGEFTEGQARGFRVAFPCGVAAGCGATTFLVIPVVNDSAQALDSAALRLTTHYFPPATP
jgi:hypothetical protein